MHKRIFALGVAAMTMLGGPSIAMNTVSVPQAPASADTPVAPAPSCDDCDSTETTAPQTDSTMAGSNTGPIVNPTSGHPAHTDVPSHVSAPPKSGGG